MAVNSFASIGLLALLAMLTGVPFVFPSLGPTAFMVFARPLAASASPRQALAGHLIGILCGYLALRLFGLADTSSVMLVGMDVARVFAAAFSLAATGALMMILHVSHPPASATTLIVSLGFVHEPRHLVMIEVAVALLVAQAIVVNRIAGVRYPLWSPTRSDLES